MQSWDKVQDEMKADEQARLARIAAGEETEDVKVFTQVEPPTDFYLRDLALVHTHTYVIVGHAMNNIGLRGREGAVGGACVLRPAAQDQRPAAVEVLRHVVLQPRRGPIDRLPAVPDRKSELNEDSGPRRVKLGTSAVTCPFREVLQSD